MKVRTDFFSKLKWLNTPLKVALLITPLAVGIALMLEWLISNKATTETIWITTPVAFSLTYLVTSSMFHYQRLIDEKNTLLRAMTRDLRRANEIMASQNTELDAFAHTVAHELKTPLGVVLGYSHLLGRKEYYEHPERIQDVGLQITQTGLKMNSIIQEMLLLASLRQKEDIQALPLDMDEIVAEALHRLDTLIVETQAKIKKPETWPTVHGNGPWIEEVWSNYISNALKYGGRSPEIELGAEKQSDGHVRFWVRDFGPGMTAEEQERVFSQFTRFNKTKAAGHGLGLSISQRIIEKLGGKVGVESYPQNGSIFYFTLPQAS